MIGHIIKQSLLQVWLQNQNKLNSYFVFLLLYIQYVYGLEESEESAWKHHAWILLAWTKVEY